jgi:anti-anti-sigma factor
MVSGVDQGGAEPVFAATAELDGAHVTVVVTGEVDMSTADQMFRAATPAGAARASLDLRGVTFFDSAAIHALIRLSDRYPDALDVTASRPVRRVLDISGLSGQPWLVAD